MARVIYELLFHKQRVKKKKRAKKYKNKRCAKDGDEKSECDMGIKYERVRALRIKENLEKMKQLGLNTNILDQAKRVFRQDVQLPVMEKKKATTPVVSRLQKDAIGRRASPRLMKKQPSLLAGDEICIENKGKKKIQNEEVYTSEHEKLLGDCNSPWFLFDDKDKRLYDSVNGITCHQCRQKTLGPRTECNACHNSYGRLCGKCLYIRYGENLLEAKEKESWKCPACRGICNCSRCREKKGWPPTGSIHDHAWKLGYKSVAHYLIHTRRAQSSTTIPLQLP